MNFISIDFTDIQFKNLLNFLDRVNIQGFAEISAFNEIVNILTKFQNTDQIK